jgi:hypothetical protein
MNEPRSFPVRLPSSRLLCEEEGECKVAERRADNLEVSRKLGERVLKALGTSRISATPW